MEIDQVQDFSEKYIEEFIKYCFERKGYHKCIENEKELQSIKSKVSDFDTMFNQYKYKELQNLKQETEKNYLALDDEYNRFYSEFLLAAIKKFLETKGYKEPTNKVVLLLFKIWYNPLLVKNLVP